MLAPLLIFAKRWQFCSFISSVKFGCVCSNRVSPNGKSIGEVREFEELKVQERPNGADIFSMKRTYKKIVEWKNSGGKKSGVVQLRLSSRILPIQC